MAELACPHCGFSKSVGRELLPPVGSVVTCPSCRGTFPLLDPEPVAEQGAGAQPHLWDTAVLSPSGGRLSAVPEGSAGEGAAASGPSLRDAGSPPFPPSKPLGAGPERFRTLCFSFTGDAKEYFGIWIVNTLLRIVTLGFYSPWAKVRKRRYFYANTLLDGAPFDYLADPLAILKGWLIAGTFFGIYSFASRTSPIGSGIMFLLFLGLYPWVMVRSRMFSLRNSAHRNIRLSFSPNYQEAYKVYLCWGLLAPLSLGLFYPYVMHAQKRFQVENSWYGTTPFRFHATVKEYYRVFAPLLVLIPVAFALVFAVAFAAKGASAKGASAQGASANLAVALVGFGFFTCYLAVAGYLWVALANLTWSATSLGGHRFRCQLRVRDLVWIYLSNAVAVLCSLGLLAPWAAVRLARYRLDKLTLTGVGSLGSILAKEQEAPNATGEELGDMLGFDLGL